MKTNKTINAKNNKKTNKRQTQPTSGPKSKPITPKINSNLHQKTHLLTLLLTVLAGVSKPQIFYPAQVEDPLPPDTTPPATPSDQTNDISYENIFSLCLCNLTPGVCDPLCCCDPACTDAQKTFWETNYRIACGGYISDITDTCYRSNYIYRINKRKGMMEIPSNNSRFVCIRGGQLLEEEYAAFKVPNEKEIEDLRVEGYISANFSLNNLVSEKKRRFSVKESILMRHNHKGSELCC